MEFITVQRIPEKSPKEMLLELFVNAKEPLMSADWFNKFCKCDGVLKDYLANYDAYFFK